VSSYVDLGYGWCVDGQGKGLDSYRYGFGGVRVISDSDCRAHCDSNVHCVGYVLKDKDRCYIYAPPNQGDWVAKSSSLTKLPYSCLRKHMLQVGDRVEILYQGAWYAGILKKKPGQVPNRQHSYGVQCDADKEGVVTWGTSVRPICTVEVYQHGDFTGWQVPFGAGTYNLDGAQDNNASSIKVVGSGCIAKMYQHGNLTGWEATFSEGDYDQSRFVEAGARNDDASSLTVYMANRDPKDISSFTEEKQCVDDIGPSMQEKTLTQCKELCVNSLTCVGVEHSATSRVCRVNYQSSAGQRSCWGDAKYYQRAKTLATIKVMDGVRWGLGAPLIEAWDGLCLDASQRNTNRAKVHMWTCDAANKSQQWEFDSATGQVKNVHGICLDASQRSSNGGKVHMFACDTYNKNQQWAFNVTTGQIRAIHGKCLDSPQRHIIGGKVHMWDCSIANKNQQWFVANLKQQASSGGRRLSDAHNGTDHDNDNNDEDNAGPPILV